MRQKVAAVVAVQVIPARQAITAADVEVREVPLDPTNANGVITDPANVIGRIPAVSILQGQLITDQYARLQRRGRTVLDPRSGRDRWPGLPRRGARSR